MNRDKTYCTGISPTQSCGRRNECERFFEIENEGDIGETWFFIPIKEDGKCDYFEEKYLQENNLK